MIKISIMNTNDQLIIGMWDALRLCYGADITVYNGEIGRWKQTSFDGSSVIWVSPDGNLDIRDFKHPEGAIYIFGSDNYNNNIPKEAEESVKIPLPIRNQSLWSPQAGAIILYDIWIKNG